jgi:hypothetical protein
MAKQPTTEEIRFIVDVRPSKYSDHGRLDAVLYPVYIEDGKIRNCSWSSLGDRGADLADLRVEGWVDRDSVNKDDFYWGGHGYNSIEYREVYTIDQARAESMVKTLRRINRKMDALEKKWGYAQDFAQFCGYLAVAIANSSGAVFARRVPNSGRGWSYDDSEYTWLDSNSLRYYFKDELRKWRGDQ